MRCWKRQAGPIVPRLSQITRFSPRHPGIENPVNRPERNPLWPRTGFLFRYDAVVKQIPPPLAVRRTIRREAPAGLEPADWLNPPLAFETRACRTSTVAIPATEPFWSVMYPHGPNRVVRRTIRRECVAGIEPALPGLAGASPLSHTHPMLLLTFRISSQPCHILRTTIGSDQAEPPEFSSVFQSRTAARHGLRD